MQQQILILSEERFRGDVVARQLEEAVPSRYRIRQVTCLEDVMGEARASMTIVLAMRHRGATVLETLKTDMRTHDLPVVVVAEPR